MIAPLINLTAKARFLESNENISAHRKLVDSREFQRACDFAMLSFAHAASQAPIAPEEMSLGAAGLKLRGAHEFLSIFRNLSEAPQKPPTILRHDNLNHEV